MGVTPHTTYVRDGDAHLAYQIVSSSGPDLLLVPNAPFPIDLLWDEPHVASQLQRLASFSRLVTTDLLGLGSSDAVAVLDDCPAMQSWADGLVAVLGAAGTQCASVFAMAESALPVMLLAASHPERVRSLVLWSPFARFSRAPDYSVGMPEPYLTRYINAVEELFGTGASAQVLAPSWIEDDAKLRWLARSERLTGGPGYFKSIYELYARSDMRTVLGSIQAPTLLLHRRGDRHVRSGHVRYLADRIPQSRLVEFDGDDHVWFAGDSDSVLDEIQQFLTGTRAAALSSRVLATVLFTDIVSSTQRAAILGDRAWMHTLDAHNSAVEQHVANARGALVKFTGDGALATFDGPARAINCACAIRDALSRLGLSVRVGLHTGEVEAVGNDVRGIAVHIAARITSLAGPGEVLVSGVIPPLVLGSRITFLDRGSHELKGVPGPWPVLAVRDSVT